MSYATADRSARRRLLIENWCVLADPRDPERQYMTGWPSQITPARFLEAGQHYRFPISRQRLSVAERFRELVRWWKADTELLSSPIEMAMHPAYQQIIGLGPEAVPLLLEELEKDPDHWFWALKAITGIDPVGPAQRGEFKEMTRAWVQWGREKGLISEASA